MSSVQERSGGRREAGPVALRQSDYTHTNNSQAGPGGILSCLGFFLICSLAIIGKILIYVSIVFRIHVYNNVWNVLHC